MIITVPYGTFTLPDDDGQICDQLQSGGFWDPDIQPYLDLVPPGAVVFDIGAHVGLYTGYLASRGCQVVAFERHPVYLPLLIDNLCQNAWHPPMVHLHPTFLYSRFCHLEEHREHTIRASNTWRPVDTATADSVIGRALDNLILPKPTLLKIDAQGCDLHILLGAETLIQECRPNILIEYEASLVPHHGHTVADYRQWLTDHRYQETSINGWNAYWTPIP